MKSPEHILAEASMMIASMHNRPSMHVGPTCRPNAAEIFDGMMRVAHCFWATIQLREGEFRRVLSNIRETHKCDSQGFSEAFRQYHPDADEEFVFQHVRECWAEIDAELKIDISNEASMPSEDA